ncbi:hypothetical protein [Streptomyces sp. NPDC002952]
MLHDAIALARDLTDDDIHRAGNIAGCTGDADAMVKAERKYR